MKVFFNKKDVVPFSELSTYSSLNPIPFTLKLSNTRILPDTIYARNLSGENFIEFRFDTDTRELYEITLVAVQNSTVRLFGDDVVRKDDYFNCCIDEESELDISLPIQILRTSKSLNFIWSTQDLKYYYVAQNCLLGVDNDNNLSSVSLLNLSGEMIFEILGF